MTLTQSHFLEGDLHCLKASLQHCEQQEGRLVAVSLSTSLAVGVPAPPGKHVPLQGKKACFRRGAQCCR